MSTFLITLKCTKSYKVLEQKNITNLARTIEKYEMLWYLEIRYVQVSYFGTLKIK